MAELGVGFCHTMNVPFMPAAACPGTVHTYGYFPALSVTVSFPDLPGASIAVFLPAILKSCASFPLFTTVKTTVPCLAVLVDSANLNSVAVTLTAVVAERAVCAGAANAGTATASAAKATAIPAPRRAGDSERCMTLLRADGRRLRRGRGTQPLVS
jgi:hypothetical protein